MAKVCSLMPELQRHDHASCSGVIPTASLAPAPPRKMRVREVSSRFMSPVVSSSSSGDLHLPSSKCPVPKRSQSAQTQQLQQPQPLSCADDNRIDVIRSFETPLLGSHTRQFHKKRSSKENGGGTGKPLSRSRPDTPVVTFQNMDRRTTPRSMVPTAARKLVQISLDSETTSTDENVIEQGRICSSPPDLRSSMPEPDFLPTMSTRRSYDSWNDVGDSCKLSACHRSLNSPISNASRSVYKPPSFPSKPNPNSLKSSITLLPPQQSYTKVGAETRKSKKVSSHTEDVHTLRLLYNRYLQWRYVNARAEAAMGAQLIAAQKSLYALVLKISELHESVEKKHNELGELKKTGIISSVLEAQMPYLDEWSALEGEYSSSISEAVKALQDVSLRLPIAGNVRASITDIAGALNSASNVMDLLFLLVESFLPKGEEMDILMSQVARVVSRERALIDECGDLLTKTHNLQVEECSLRGQLIQLKQIIISSDQTKTKHGDIPSIQF